MGGGEHDIGDADQRHAGQQMPQRHGAANKGCRNAQDHQCPDHVRCDHQPPPAEPVHPDADRQAQDKERTHAQGVNDSHLESARAKHGDSNDRDHHPACFIPDALERAGNPQLPERNQPH